MKKRLTLIIIGILAAAGCAIGAMACNKNNHNHAITPVEAVAATCTQTGNIAYYKCEECDKYYSDAEGKTEITKESVVTPVNPDAHNYGEWQIKDSTCTQTGVKKRVCTYNVSHTETVEIPTKIHTVTAVEAVAATCTQTGNIAYYKCYGCDKYYSDAEGTNEINMASVVIPVNPDAHNYGEWQITDSTCTKKGERKRVCTHNAEHVEKEEIPTKPHTMTTVAAVEATCVAEGNIAHYKCNVCKKYFSDSEGKTEITEASVVTAVNADAHDWGEWHITDSTCTEKGEKTRVCTHNATHTQREEIPTKPHAMTHIPEIVANCGSTGYKEYYSCSSCKKDYMDEDGKEVITDKTALITPVNPTVHVFGGWQQTIAPTCTIRGEERRYCIYNKEHIDYNYPDMLPHNLTLKESAPTCTVEGSKPHYECSTCQNYFSDSEGKEVITDKSTVAIPVIAHTLTHFDEVPATCIKEGTYEHYKCSVCSKIFNDKDGKFEIASVDELVIIVNTEAHKWGEWQTLEEGTCITKGKLQRICQHNKEHTEIKELTYFGNHSLERVAPKNATCIATGNTEYWVCKHCQKWYSDSEAQNKIDNKDSVIIPLAEHKYDEKGICTVCRMYKFTAGLEYKKSEDGMYAYLSGMGTATTTGIVIANLYEGLPVTKIAANAFKDCKDLLSVSIPQTVTEIGESAFSGCTGLLNITLPESVVAIGNTAFSMCVNLQRVNILGKITVISQGAFYDCAGLTKITIPDSVTAIYNSAFYGCKGIMNLTIPDSVEIIYGSAFNGCESLTHLIIGQNVKEIKADAFLDCFHLIELYNKSSLTITSGSTEHGCVGYYVQNIYTEPGGSKLSTMDNGLVIYNKNTVVGFTGDATELTIPEGITAIDNYAFYNQRNLASITLPASLTAIDDNAFKGCYHLIEICNKSALVITKGGTDNGGIAANATNICTDEAGKKTVVTTDDGFIIFGGDTLVNYVGTKTAIKVPDGIKTIVGYTFYYCDQLTEITIPDSVTNIMAKAFEGCTSLTTLTIGKGVTELADEIFKNFTSLKTVVLAGVTTIGNDAFSGCTGLTSITLSGNLKRIGAAAFHGCSSLTEIKFEGDKAKWESVKFSAKSWNYGTGEYVVSCSDGKLDKEGNAVA